MWSLTDVLTPDATSVADLSRMLSALHTQVPPDMRYMDPSVMCGQDRMKFMVHGADAQQFSVDPGDFVLSTHL